ncbi:MAG: MBL fold metallo-hydrolase [Alphaproteobacteria bacterium]|nr:MBL fold metallo-hydrolase [Alphaproteobacteria bacterium]
MLQIKRFTFNNFMVNTYILWDETGKAVVVDAACYSQKEQQEFSSFIENQNLTIERHLNTHCHIDHILGNEYLATTYKVLPEYHIKSIPFFVTAREIGESFGFKIGWIPEAGHFLVDGEEVRWNQSVLKVLYTPGHAEGSLCFYSEVEKFVITGDVLFKDTIGRTDLPSGNFDLLMQSIKTRLFTLPPDTVVFPGHGPETTIGYEMAHNPFIR